MSNAGNGFNIRDTMIELDVLLALASILRHQSITDEELRHFDTLTDFAYTNHVSLDAAAQATGAPISRGVFIILLLGYLQNWTPIGCEAALGLPNAEVYAAMTRSRMPHEHDVIPHVLETMRALGLAAVVDDRESWGTVGDAMLKVTNAALVSGDSDTDLCVQAALAARNLLARCGNEGAELAQMIAYRLLVWSKRLPFLADLAPSKFPPPISPRYDSAYRLHLLLTFLQLGILDQSFDLERVVREMVGDPDTVIRNSFILGTNGEREVFDFELALGPALVAWSLDNESEETRQFGTCVDLKLRAMFDLCCSSRELLEHHRDEDLCDIYIMAYIGTGPAPDNRLGLALKIEMINNLVHCIIGLSEADARARESYAKAAGLKEPMLMAHLEAVIRAG